MLASTISDAIESDLKVTKSLKRAAADRDEEAVSNNTAGVDGGMMAMQELSTPRKRRAVGNKRPKAAAATGARNGRGNTKQGNNAAQANHNSEEKVYFECLVWRFIRSCEVERRWPILDFQIKV